MLTGYRDGRKVVLEVIPFLMQPRGLLNGRARALSWLTPRSLVGGVDARYVAEKIMPCRSRGPIAMVSSCNQL